MVTAARHLLLATLVARPLAAAEPAPQLCTPAAWASDQYESHPTFSPDGREAFFMRSNREFSHYRLMHSRFENGAWTPPVEPPFAGPPAVLEADPSLSADGRTLYFLSSRLGHSEGRGIYDLDIWQVDRRPDGGWGEARRLPAPVNSGESELCPRLQPDGRLLFGSARPGGFGKTDIYLATPGSNGSWGVENLGPDINSAEDEYEAEISRDGSTLILVSNRQTRSHLFRFAREGGRWVPRGRLPGYDAVFQTGPLFSPKGDRLLFGQAHADRSGEMFLLDLTPHPDRAWPPGFPPQASAATRTR